MNAIDMDARHRLIIVNHLVVSILLHKHHNQAACRYRCIQRHQLILAASIAASQIRSAELMIVIDVHVCHRLIIVNHLVVSMLLHKHHSQAACRYRCIQRHQLTLAASIAATRIRFAESMIAPNKEARNRLIMTKGLAVSMVLRKHHRQATWRYCCIQRHQLTFAASIPANRIRSAESMIAIDMDACHRLIMTNGLAVSMVLPKHHSQATCR